GQVGDEGNAKFQLVDVMLGIKHLVVELDVAVVHADIGQRKTRGRRRWLTGLCREAVKQIAEVEFLRRGAGDMDLRALHRQLVQHRGQSENRCPGGVDYDLIEVDKGRWTGFFP